jgi:hypothetical protein
LLTIGNLFTAKILGLPHDERKTAGVRIRPDDGESGIGFRRIALLSFDLGRGQFRP